MTPFCVFRATAVGLFAMDLHKPYENGEFGENADIVRSLLQRLDSSSEPFTGADEALIFTLKGLITESQLAHLQDVVARKEAEHENAQREALKAELEKRRGCLGQLFALFPGGTLPPLASVPLSNPRFEALRRLLGEEI